MKILLTGATGSLGKFVLVDLLSLGHEVLTIGRRTPNISSPLHSHESFDFRKDSSLQLSFAPKVIIHMAGITRGQAKNETEYKKVNVQSTEILVEFALKHNSKFIYASSASVYGEGLNLKENSPLNGTSLYAKSKIEAEQVIQKKIQNYLVFRIASAFGKGTQSFIHKLYHYGKSGFFPYPVKAKQLQKTFIHIEDVSHFIVKSLEKDITGIFNLAHPQPKSYLEILQIIEKKLAEEKKNKPVKIYLPKTIWILEKKMRNIQGKDSLLSPLFESSTLNVKKLEESFGEIPKHDLKEIDQI